MNVAGQLVMSVDAPVSTFKHFRYCDTVSITGQLVMSVDVPVPTFKHFKYCETEHC